MRLARSSRRGGGGAGGSGGGRLLATGGTLRITASCSTKHRLACSGPAVRKAASSGGSSRCSSAMVSQELMQCLSRCVRPCKCRRSAAGSSDMGSRRRRPRCGAMRAASARVCFSCFGRPCACMQGLRSHPCIIKTEAQIASRSDGMHGASRSALPMRSSAPKSSPGRPRRRARSLRSSCGGRCRGVDGQDVALGGHALVAEQHHHVPAWGRPGRAGRAQGEPR